MKRGGMLAAVLLTAVFIFSAAALTAAGARAYLAIQRDIGRTDALRASCAYLTGKVRSCQGEATVTEDVGVGTVLCLSEELAGEKYLTRIYLLNGMLTENFQPENTPFDPDSGEPLTALVAFDAEKENGLVRFCVTLREEDGGSREEFSVRAGEGKAT
ncbi:MAG: DUF4860 domain-containing protein [Oscillospiraceae bacterium]|nr:DUF4860 domain-containing protein [Oscillospiraceae bacterium]